MRIASAARVRLDSDKGRDRSSTRHSAGGQAIKRADTYNRVWGNGLAKGILASRQPQDLSLAAQ